jgi:hypothetical protein
MDMMSLNALIAWNLSAKEIPGRPELRRHEFLWYIAQCMLDYRDDSTATTAPTKVSTATTIKTATTNKSRSHSPITNKDSHARCVVC